MFVRRFGRDPVECAIESLEKWLDAFRRTERRSLNVDDLALVVKELKTERANRRE